MKKIITALFLLFVYLSLANKPASAVCDPTKFNAEDKYETIDRKCNDGDCEASYWKSSTGEHRWCWRKNPTTVDPEMCPGGYTYKESANECCRRKAGGEECVPITPHCTNPDFDLIDGKCIRTRWPGAPGLKAKRICEDAVDKNRCKDIEDPEEKGECESTPLEEDPAFLKCDECFHPKKYGSDNPPGAWTALGCIPADAGGFVGWLLGPLMGIGGGIAFLLLLKGGYQIMFSQGNPETVAEGRQTITSAVIGLLVIIGSVFILKIIGIDILDLPGFKP